MKLCRIIFKQIKIFIIVSKKLTDDKCSMTRKEAFMEALDLSIVKQGDAINFINSDKTLFSGTIVKEYKGCLAAAVSIKQNNYRKLHEKEQFELIYASKDKVLRCSSVFFRKFL